MNDNLIIAAMLDGIDNLLKIKTASGGLEMGAAVLVPVVNKLGVEWEGFRRVKATVASLDTKNVTDPVEIPEAKNKLSDDGVETRAEATAGHNSSLDPGRIEQDLASWAGAVVCQGTSSTTRVALFFFFTATSTCCCSFRLRVFVVVDDVAEDDIRWGYVEAIGLGEEGVVF